MKTCHKPLFASLGLKNTEHRDVLYHVLQNSSSPLSAEAIYQTMKQEGYDLSLSTVYRILEVFMEKQLVIQFSHPDKTSVLYELKPLEHGHHLVCIGCNKTLYIAGCPLASYEQELAKEQGFYSTHHQLTIFGYCDECQQKKRIKK